MDTRLSIPRPGEWTRVDNARPKCPQCRTGAFPFRFEPRLHIEVRVLSTFAPEHGRLPTATADGDPHYHFTFQHRDCKRILEFRQRDPAILSMRAAA